MRKAVRKPKLKSKRAPARRPKTAPRRKRQTVSLRQLQTAGLRRLKSVSKLLSRVEPRAYAAAAGAVLVAIVAVQVARHAGSPRMIPSAPAPAKQDRFFVAAGKLPLGDRISYWSEILWKRKLSNGQLADRIGPAPEIRDTAPLLPASYDCTTYVETVAALARSRHQGEFYPYLLSIRYRDPENATFFSRNHFPEADWIPNNVRAGNLTDITREIADAAGVDVQTEAKEIRRGDWLQGLVKKGKVSRKIASVADPSWAAPTDVKVPYLSTEDVEKYASHIPNGTVLNIVRKSEDRYPVLITHQGFVIRKGEQALFRHASPDGSIKTIELVRYLRFFAKRDAGKWPIVGVNLNRVAE